jgi:Resolvase, N terminal domain
MPNTNGHGLKRAVLWAILYARVSTDEQARSGYSLAQQLEALREYAAREGYEVLEEVVDPGQSGASLERPGMDRVRDLVAGGGVSVVLAQDRDRFSREPAYTYLLRREFEEHGCELRSLNTLGVSFDHHPNRSAKARRGRPSCSLSHMQKLCSATLAASRARSPPSSWGRSRQSPKVLKSLS